MALTTESYGIGVRVACSFNEAIDRVKAALQAEGWGVLTEIDMSAKLREKLGAELAAYTILGACNPPLAKQALDIEPDIGLVMPCNVTIRQVGNDVWVKAIDSVKLDNLIQNTEVRSVLEAAHASLQRALERLES